VTDDPIRGDDGEAEPVTAVDDDAAGPDSAVDRDPAPVADRDDDRTVVCAWSTDGTVCSRCGATVRRTWVADGERVCGSCRSW
jgi:hypothetical protein